MKSADKTQELRDALKIPLLITSGFRCPLLNKAVGGSRNSKHMQFLAIDCISKDLSPNELVRRIKKTGVSVDKCFVERECVHIQFCMNDEDNRNFFGTANRINDEWVVESL